MAISRVGAAAGDGTTITIPAGHQIGDLILGYGFRSALTSPTLPAGWTNLTTPSTGASSARIGWKLATSSSETSGTWTNASGLICLVYRGVATDIVPVGPIGGAATATSANVNYPIRTLNEAGTSWLVAFAAIKTTTAGIGTAPANLTNIVDTVGAANEYAAFDSNGAYTIGQGTWPSTTVGVGTSAEWRTYIMEIYPEKLNGFQNYMSIKAGDGMSVSEKIR